MKRFLPFLVRLVLVAVLFIPLLPLLHEAYRFVLALLCTAAFPTREAMESIGYDGFNNLYTLLVLLLGIPGLAPGKRAVGSLAGLALFLGADFFMAVIWPYLKTPQPSLANMAVSYSWLVVAHYLLPFLVWFCFAFREVEELFKGGGMPDGRAA